MFKRKYIVIPQDQPEPKFHSIYTFKIIWEMLFFQGKMVDALQMTKSYNFSLAGTKERTGSC